MSATLDAMPCALEDKYAWWMAIGVFTDEVVGCQATGETKREFIGKKQQSAALRHVSYWGPAGKTLLH